MMKKRIVAMMLALSVFASTFGMLGAAAADAEPLDDAAGTPFTVTVVPLTDGEVSPPCGQSDSEANASTAGESKEEAAADEQSEGEAGTDSPSEGESSGSSEASAPSESESTDSEKKPDFSEIERPTQSDTVETLPGSAKDNEDHIKGEDKADSKDDTSEPETPAEGDDKGTTETPAEGDKDTETEEPAKDDDIDYDVAYDEDTGHFKVTFNIKEGAEGDQTIELSKVQEVVEKYGEKKFDEWLQTDPNAKNWMEDALWYAQYGQSSKKTVDFNGASYTLYVYYDEETGSVAQRVAYTNEPGCTTIFDVSLSNGSKHTYVYKDSSLTVATPDQTGKGNTGIEGFDGQELPKEYAGKTNLELKYSKTAESGCMEDLVDAALAKYGEVQHQNQFLDSEGNLTTKITKTNVPAGTEVELINGKYYVKSGDHYYGEFKPSEVQTTKDGKTVLINDKNASTLAFKKTKNGKKVEKDYYVGPFTHSSSALSNQDIRKALKPYMEEMDYETYDDYILDYYRKPDGSKYDRVSDLLKNDPKALKELSRSGSSMPNDPNTGNNTVEMDPSTLYDNFYQNVLSFKVGNQDTVDSEAGGNVDHNHSHGQWAADGTQETIGDYMAGKLNETGKWAEANSYFNTLVLSGMTEKEATWAAFTMATNIDFQNAGNDYQNTAWNWYASMVLHQADGTLDLTKTDKDTGKVIKDSETSFYLWKYKTEVDEKTHEETKSTLYYTYVDATTDKDGNEVPGYYGWVKYDPDNNQMTYTITTTNGKLNIDYELLENMVYYLQEAVAPEGYDIDTTVYIICDEEDYEQAVSDYESYGNSAGKDAGVTSDSTSWLGTIEGGKTLKIEFVNSKTVTPDPTPDPEPDSDPVPDPENPDTPVDPANPENPPVQDATPEEPTPEEPAPETPVTPDTPQNPPVQDAAPDAPVLPKTGTSAWLVHVLLAAGFLLTAGGWFFTRKQSNCKH